jgi:hypothetical protein
MLHITKRIALCACLCGSFTAQAIHFHIPSYTSARDIAQRVRLFGSSLKASLPKMIQCKALTYIQTYPKKIGVYALAATAVVSVCVCGLRAMKRHGSEGTRVSLTQRVRNFVGRLGSFMHSGRGQQAQEATVSEQQVAHMRQEFQSLHVSRHALGEQNATLTRQKEELERQKNELEQRIEQYERAYSVLLAEVRNILLMSNIEAEQLRSQLAEARKLSDDDSRRVELFDAQSEDLYNRVAAYERREGILNGRCLQLELRLDRLQHRIVTADVATQTEYPEGSPQAVSFVSHGDSAPSEMPPALPSMIDCVMSRRQIAESLYAVAGEGRAEVEGVLGQTRRMLELAQQRNKVDVTRTSGFGQTVDAALLTSYHPAQ